MKFSRWMGFGALTVLVACGSGNNAEEETGSAAPVAEPSPVTEQPSAPPSPPGVSTPDPLPPIAQPPAPPVPPVTSTPPPVVSTPEPPPPVPQPPENPTPASRRYETACSRWEYRQDGSLFHLTRLGADAVLREDAYFLPNGAAAERVMQQVDAGLVRVHEEFYGAHLQLRTEWTYGAHGEALRQEDTDHRFNPAKSFSTDYVHDSQGRLEREDHFSGGVLDSQTLYTYGEQGLERSILKEARGAYVYTSTTYTYHPNGKLAREDLQAERSHIWRELDTEGREVLSGREFDESTSRVEQQYDGQGRLTRRLSTGSGSSSNSVRDETFEYDAAGRLSVQHVAWDWTNNWTGEAHRVRETHHYEYDARGNLALQTCDTNEDGVPDWRRTFTRDAFGNVLEEKLTGGPASPLELGRTVYTYECHE